MLTPGWSRLSSLVPRRALVAAAALALGSVSCQRSPGPKAPSARATLAETATLPQAEATKRCEAAEIRACVILARVLMAGDEQARDLVKGASLLREACEKGDAYGCAVLGQSELAGLIAGADKLAGLARCRAACDASSGFGCRCLATAYGKGVGTREDVQASITFGTRSCDLGDPVGCGFAAVAHMKAEGGWASEKARALAKKGCDAGNDWSCGLAAAAIALDGEQPLQARKEAAAKLDVLCDTTEPSACLQLAAAHQKELLGARDSAERMRFFARKACEKDPGESCVAFASDLVAGEGNEANVALLRTLAEHGCRSGDAASCGWWGRTSEDGAVARRAFGRGCALGDDFVCVEALVAGPCARQDWAACRDGLGLLCTETKAQGCANLAELIRRGPDGQGDPVQALVYAKRGCEHDVGQGCLEAAAALQAKGEPGWAEARRPFLARGCTLGSGEACFRLGVSLLQPGVHDAEAAAARLDDACRLGSVEGCGYHAALLLGMIAPGAPKGSARDAMDRGVRACARGGGAGCWVEGRLLEKGLNGPKDESRAFQLYVKACATMPPCGCEDGKRMLLAARPPNLDGARELLAQACLNGGDPSACEGLGKLPPPPAAAAPARERTKKVPASAKSNARQR